MNVRLLRVCAALCLPLLATLVVLGDVADASPSPGPAVAQVEILAREINDGIEVTDAQSTVGAGAVANGGFEYGPDGSWEEYSLQEWPIIVTVEVMPGAAHGGTWVAWLGGDADEQNAISQAVVIPTGPSTLQYWNWIDSEDRCGYDMAGVVIDGVFEQVFYLCVENSTEGWVLREVDLSAYAGKTVLVSFMAETDSTLNSNFFVDDMSIKEGPVATPEPTVQPGPEVKNGAYLPVLFNG
jgi:hypothetical protein